MVPKLLPCENFQNLFEGPDSAWQRDESIRPSIHFRFSFVHAFDDKQFVVDDRVADLRKVQFPGNDTDDGTSLRMERLGHQTHQPDIAAAVDKADTSVRHGDRHGFRRLGVPFVMSLRRAAEHCDSFHSIHIGRPFRLIAYHG
jgi:hypothetical protein